MGRIGALLGALAVALALAWALWDSAPTAPTRHPPAPAAAVAAPVVTAPVVAKSEPRPAPPPAPVAAVLTAIQPPPDRVLNPPIPRDLEGVRRMIALQAPPAPGMGDAMNPNEAKPAPGVIDRAAIKEAIAQAKPAMGACYEQSLKRDPNLTGTVKVQFKLVAHDGTARLTDAEILDDGVHDPFLGMCMLKALAALEFAADADGEVVVNYPFVMQPEEDDAEETP